MRQHPNWQRFIYLLIIRKKKISLNSKVFDFCPFSSNRQRIHTSSVPTVKLYSYFFLSLKTVIYEIKC